MIIPGKNGQMEEQIDFSKTTEIKCESCGGQTFKQTLLMRKMSALDHIVHMRLKRRFNLINRWSHSNTIDIISIFW